MGYRRGPFIGPTGVTYFCEMCGLMDGKYSHKKECNDRGMLREWTYRAERAVDEAFEKRDW